VPVAAFELVKASARIHKLVVAAVAEEPVLTLTPGEKIVTRPAISPVRA
jgi:hypothetical protein